VTDANINYVGSITIDSALLEQAQMYPFEKVLVVDIENGARFETYIIAGPAESGKVELNGAAARLVTIGDRIIVMGFTEVPFPPPPEWSPQVVFLDQDNKVVSIKREEGSTCC
jgi:aspartate 1-decarboxylase